MREDDCSLSESHGPEARWDLLVAVDFRQLLDAHYAPQADDKNVTKAKAVGFQMVQCLTHLLRGVISSHTHCRRGSLLHGRRNEPFIQSNETLRSDDGPDSTLKPVSFLLPLFASSINAALIRSEGVTTIILSAAPAHIPARIPWQNPVRPSGTKCLLALFVDI